MQIKKIAAACAIACAAMAGTAHAALPTGIAADLTAANDAGRVVFVSGASAVQKGFATIVSKMFQSGTVTYFADSKADIGGVSYLAVLGTLKDASDPDAPFEGTWAGEKAVVIYRVSGGSVYGVDPVARATAIKTISVTSANCDGLPADGASTAPFVCAQTNGTTIAHIVPDVGVSDVAPKFFKNPYNTEGTLANENVAAPELTEDELAELEAIPLYGLAFGIPVSKTVATGAEFDRATISAIMAGAVSSWSKVRGETGGNMVVCRRTPGSGTQAVMNMWAGNYPCTTPSNVPADRSKNATGVWNDAANTYTVTQGTTDKLVVIENAGSGEVRTCLDKAVTGGSYTTKDRTGSTVTVTFDGAGHKAIGVLSMDSLKYSVNVANTTNKTTGNWQFRSLDGAGKLTWDDTAIDPVVAGTGKLPTLATYESGMWDLQGWISLNIPARTTNDAPEKRELIDYFVSQAQNPTVLDGISDLKKVSAAIPGNGYTGARVLDGKYVGGDQCAPYNRQFND